MEKEEYTYPVITTWLYGIFFLFHPGNKHCFINLKQENQKMKHPIYLLLIIFFILHVNVLSLSAQSRQEYQQQWEKVKEAEKKGLTKTAQDLVVKIYKQASKGGNGQQQLKALIYRLKYTDQIEENATVKNINAVDSLAQKAEGIPKALLQNLAANLYLGYVHQNRYALLNRSRSTTEDKEPLTTWSLSHFYDHISFLFQQSLKQKDTLKKILVKDYTILIDTGKNALRLRPSLYDILAHNALAYFTSDESSLTHPAQRFVINDPAAFAPAKIFSKKVFHTPDSTSLSWQALNLYQDLIRFHLQDTGKEALIDLDLDRLKFIYSEAVMSRKDSLYKTALQDIIDQYPSPVRSKALYLLADWYYRKGITYDATKQPEHRWALKTALTLCKKAPDTLVNDYNVHCRKLETAILRPALSLKAERVNVPNKPFRVWVQYKNASKVWFRLVKLEPEPELINGKKLSLEQLLQKETQDHWTAEFPLPADYQSHSAEMKVNALPPGRYALLASTKAGFNEKQAPVAFISFSVSNLSYISDNNGNLVVINRVSGKPVKKARVRIWKRYYNENSRKYEWKEGEKYKTDKKGFLRLTTTNDNNRYFIPEISKKQDHLFIGRFNHTPYLVSSGSEKENALKGFLFTDRSIYRPGQELYFKGLVIQKQSDAGKSEVVQGHVAQVFLLDANNQKIDSLKLKTNAFGSFAGTFHLPSALMNGRMHLSIDSLQTYQYFSVEAYKRPTYDLEWDSVSHNLQLGDTAGISGSVMGYNGSPEGGAVIKYQVIRKPYIIPRYRTYLPTPIYPHTPNATIKQGEIKTDHSGRFQIQFAALPDEEVPRGNRIFNYEIALDVTSISGESHHYSYQLPIGDKSLLLHLEMAEKADYEELDTLYLSSTDLRGKFVKTPVAVSMYALKAPDRFIRERFWPQPDQFIMDKKEYLQYFPHDEYKGEADPKSWEKGRPVFVANDTTKANGKMRFYYGNLVSGWYLIKVLAKDKYGHFVTDSQFVQVYNSDKKQIPFHQALWVDKKEFNAQPGDKVAWDLGSSEKAYVFEESERLNHTGEPETFHLNHKIKEKHQTITSKERGGLLKHYVAVKYNRIYTEDIKINVPWKNKQLHISYKTFRDHLLPGEKETWEVKIEGPDKEKVSSELLASMYDLSLDNFVPHHWNKPEALYPLLQGKIQWEGSGNFSEKSSNGTYKPAPVSYPDLSIVYPSLKNFGYHPGNRVLRYFGNAVSNGRNLSLERQPALKKNAIANRTVAPEAPAPEAQAGDKAERETPEQPAPIKTRKDFRETAFFYPQLHTDDSGNISFTFTTPEALTRWKLMLWAHTKDLEFGYSEREAVTQKPLMIQMNAPRFVRQGDTLVLSARISNLSDKSQEGTATLSFKNEVTGKTISLGADNDKYFNVNAGQNAAVTWLIPIPDHFDGALTYIINARAADFSDGEQDVIPVLTNKAALTESLPLHFSGNGTHQLQWSVVGKGADPKEKIQPEGITVEYTGNPIWYAVQALPFLDNNTRNSADALFRKIYANALSSYTALHIPHFKETMQDWLQRDSTALKSPLQKNEELKNVLLEETPWVVQAQKEAAQKAEVAHWYGREDTQLRLQNTLSALRKMQRSNGGFSWFKDMPDDRLITQQIIAGIGHMKALHAWPRLGSNDLRQIITKAIPYLDARMKEDYERLQENKKSKSVLTPTAIQYLYARSFFRNIKLNDSVRTAYRYFLKQARTDWPQQNIYLKAQLALTFHRLDSNKLAQAILRSITEHAIHDKNGGMYWKQQAAPLYWYQNPIEMQAACIEAYKAIGADSKTINALRTWLLSQKQTQYWGRRKATADAVYALLLTGTEWTDSKIHVQLQLGQKSYDLGARDKEGLQYQKFFIPATDIDPDMQNIRVKITGAAQDQPSWGALYFQYFENMNRVKKGENRSLHINRRISLETPTGSGPVLSPVSSENTLQVGDKVQVRLIVKAERDMDFVHLKDVRASCMEPLQVLSGYQRENGVGYYSTVSDAAVHFYFRHLPKGTYVFTYPVYITQKGNFTGGLSQIECLYAPEIRAHSEGVRLHIK